MIVGTASIAALLFLVGQTAESASTPNPVSELDLFALEQLLSIETTVASERKTTLRDTPAIVTLVTRDEIQRLGLRDEIDILRLVPGFTDFTPDTWGTVAPIIRGTYGTGRYLIRIDGQEFNELMWAIVPLGNHFSVDQIEKVEIIRGPGSAVYGGFGEYTVINITTRIGAEKEGLDLSYQSGFHEKNYARQNAQLSYGKSLMEGDAYLGLSAFGGLGQRSDDVYTDIYGSEGTLLGRSALDPLLINTHLRYKEGHVRFIYDNFRSTHRDGYDQVLTPKEPSDFLSYLGDASYDLRPAEGLTLTPQFRFAYQVPWRNTRGDSARNPFYYDPSITRYSGALKATFAPTRELTVLAGYRFDYDQARYSKDMSYPFYNGSRHLVFQNHAVFGEGSWYSDIVNVTVGARFEAHSRFGNSFVPRVALTKVLGDFHAKAIYNRAFRPPAVEEYNFGKLSGRDIVPETTDFLELELGYRFTEAMLATLNVFDISAHDLIQYYYDPDLFNATAVGDTYDNFDRAGSRGLELEYRLTGAWGFLTANYSFYRAKKTDGVYIAVPDAESASGYRYDVYLGAPAHKATLAASVDLSTKLSVSPSMIFASARWGDTGYDNATGYSIIEEVDPYFIANLYFWYRDVVAGLDIGLGAYNLLDADIVAVQAYDGYHAPLPMGGREITAKLAYRLF